MVVANFLFADQNSCGRVMILYSSQPSHESDHNIFTDLNEPKCCSLFCNCFILIWRKDFYLYIEERLWKWASLCISGYSGSSLKCRASMTQAKARAQRLTKEWASVKAGLASLLQRHSAAKCYLLPNSAYSCSLVPIQRQSFGGSRKK